MTSSSWHKQPAYFVPQPSTSLDISVLRGCTVIIPAVSVGNVGQLCMDVLTATQTMEFHKIGTFNESAILPVVGYRRSPELRLLLPLEVFYSSSAHLVAVQQRASIIPSEKNAFSQRIAEWCLSIGAAHVVIVSSSHAHKRNDKLLSAPSFACLASPIGGAADRAIDLLDWIRLSAQQDAHLYNERIEGDETLAAIASEERETIAAHIIEAIATDGSGCTRDLFKACVSFGVATSLVTSYVYEGFNSSDGIVMADIINIFLSRIKGESVRAIKWQTPSEWNDVFAPSHTRSAVYT